VKLRRKKAGQCKEKQNKSVDIIIAIKPAADSITDAFGK